jgi:hypothetical protein
MEFLQRVLKLQAALWALTGLALLIVPGTVLSDVLTIGQTPGVVAFARLLGVTAIALALAMVLVAQHANEAWWWAWCFAILEAGVATVCVLHALWGVPEGYRAWPWWLAGVVSIVFGGLDLVGLARAEQAKPIA